SPALSTTDIAALFEDNTRLRIGMAIVAFVSPLFMGLAAPIGVQLRRIEGQHHVFSNLQLCSAAVGVLALQFPGLFWLAASYRPGIDPDVVATFSDVSWFLILGGVAPAIAQNLCIAGAILLAEKPHDVFPRWLGFFNLWIALTFVPDVMLPFFKTGPFAWNGLFGFWVVAIGFATWILVQYGCTLQAIRRQRESLADSPPPATVPAAWAAKGAVTPL
ncbi:MAG: hypothetical protein ABW110_02340, partial [Steroidobacteraceae bacterium]